MEAFMKGDVVVVPFPFSDLSSSKKRPTLVTASLDSEDIILCQITGEDRIESYSIMLDDPGFKQGGLKVSSIIRPNRLFTADKSIILYKVGSIKNHKMKQVEKEIINIFTS